MNWRNDLGDLLDTIAYGVLYAPDEFPEEDYLAPEEQMTFARFSQELRDRLRRLSSDLQGHADVPRLNILLEEALRLYSSGQRNEGAWKLQEIEALLKGA